MFVCVCVCVWCGMVCVCERQTDRQTGGQAGRQTDTLRVKVPKVSLQQASPESQLFSRFTNLSPVRDKTCVQLGVCFGGQTGCTWRDTSSLCPRRPCIRTHRKYQTQQALLMLNNRKTFSSTYRDLISPSTRPREFGISMKSIASSLCSQKPCMYVHTVNIKRNKHS